MTDTAPDALKQAVEAIGSASAAARALGITPQAVSEILRKGRQAPAEWCIPLEKATDGKISRHDLRPDLYPVEQSEAAA